MYKQKRSLKQAVVGLFTGLAALVAPGCFTGGSIGAYVGSHAPSSQNQEIVKFDNSTETGIRARVKTKSKIELEIAYGQHKTNWTDGFENDDLEVTDVSAGVSYPIWSNGTVSVNASAGAVSRTETQTATVTGFPGSSVHDRSSTGWKAGVDVRWQPTQSVSVEAGVECHGFGKGDFDSGSYEKTGTTVSVGASYNF